MAGNRLDQLIAPRGRPKGLKLNETLEYGIRIADALSEAHAASIIHRDLKPGNLMVTGDRLVKVLDFGLAKLAQAGEGQVVSPAEAPTRTMKPETEKGAILGTLLYEMLAGRRPFPGDSQLSTRMAMVRDPPAPVKTARPDVPADGERILHR